MTILFYRWIIITKYWMFWLFLLIDAYSNHFIRQSAEVIVRKYRYKKKSLIRVKQYWKILTLVLQKVTVNWVQSALKVNSFVKIYTCWNIISRDCHEQSGLYAVTKWIIWVLFENNRERFWHYRPTYHSFDGLSLRILPNGCACNIRLSAVIARKGVTGQPAASNALAVQTLQVLNKW